MKLKHLFTVCAMCLLMWVASYLMKRAKTPDPLAFENFPLKNVKSMIIREAEANVKLNKENDLWYVDSSQSYLANDKMIEKFLQDLRDLKSQSIIEIKEDYYDRFEVNDPLKKKGNTGVSIDFYDKNGQKIDQIILGKISESNKKLRHLLHPKSSKIASVFNPFQNIQAKPEKWLKSYFFNPKDIVKISREENEGLKWILIRNSIEDKFELNIESSHDPVMNNISKLHTELENIYFIDVDDPDVITSKVLNNNLIVEQQNGLILNLKYGIFKEGENRLYAKLDFELSENSQLDENEVLKLKSRFSEWIYVLRKGDFMSFYFAKKDLAKNIASDDMFDAPKFTPDDEKQDGGGKATIEDEFLRKG